MQTVPKPEARRAAARLGSTSPTGFGGRSPMGVSPGSTFRVFAHLRPVGQRLYALLRGSYRDSYDQAIEFYLAEPLRYTLGLRGGQHRAAQSVRTALTVKAMMPTS